MEYFVTGGTGFVGSHLVSKLIDLGHKVHCLVRSKEKLRYLEGKNVKLILPDEFESSSSDILKSMDAVINVAGVTKANRRDEYFNGNVEMTGWLMNLLISEKFPGRFIVISSQAAAGPSKGDIPIVTTDVPNPQTWYGESKLAQENLVKEKASGLKWTILRPPAVFGPNDTDMLESFRLAKKGINPLISGKDKLISIIYVKDLASAIIAALQTAVNINEKIYFVGNRQPATATELNQMAADYFGKKLRNVFIPEFLLVIIGNVYELLNRFSKTPNILSRQKIRELLPQYWVCDTETYCDDVDFDPAYSIEDAVNETMEWYVENKWI